MDENLPQSQVPVPPIEQPIPKKSFPLKWVLIVTFIVVFAGIFFVLISRSLNKVVNTNESIKIGEYKVLAKDGWEELGYLNTREAKNTDDVYAVFSQLYSNYVDKKNEMYVKDIVVKGDTAEIYFGGDESWLTDRMGSTGPYNYSGLVTFALTEDPGIKKVDFKLKLAGTHFGPGIRNREDFIDLWPIEMLEKVAIQGNKRAQELLQFRKTANWKTYTTEGVFGLPAEIMQKYPTIVKGNVKFKYPNNWQLSIREPIFTNQMRYGVVLGAALGKEHPAYKSPGEIPAENSVFIMFKLKVSSNNPDQIIDNYLDEFGEGSIYDKPLKQQSFNGYQAAKIMRSQSFPHVVVFSVSSTTVMNVTVDFYDNGKDQTYSEETTREINEILNSITITQ